MGFYLVRLRRVVEFEAYYEADAEELARDLARLEAGPNGTVVDEQMITLEMDPAGVDQ